MDSTLQALIDAAGSSSDLPAWSYFVPLVVTFILYKLWQRGLNSGRFPTINLDKKAASAKERFVSSSRKLLAEGAQKFGGPFNLITESGPIIILPPSSVEAVNAEKNLSFTDWVRVEHLSKFGTFRTMRPWPHGMFSEAILKGITRPLPKFTKPMSLEMTRCLDDTWGQQKKWHATYIMDDIQGWTARLSAIVFLGEELARNKEWVRITTTFTINLFTAIRATKYYHPLLRPLVDLFAPLNRQVRHDMGLATAILKPVLAARHEEHRAAEREGRKPNVPDDAIEWFRKSSNGRKYPEIHIQLGLAQVAIQTTSSQLTQCVLNLCAHPEYIQPLRDEALSVLRKHGLHKPALSELYLLDSFLKETQRLKPESMATMHRRAMTDLELDVPGADPIHIKKGDHLAVSSHSMWDETNYPKPHQFNPYRFVERRQIPGYEHKSAYVSTSADHLGFAHGKLACPGRFLAANMMKIAMLHLIFKYDLKIDDPEDAKWWEYGTDMVVKMKAKIWVKSRLPEIDLEALAFDL
ncbi:cytochrome P450 [Aspergillus undulatus]|uniref:cytochrome P450 n=1 Tax=Aspergillus undulatus TaxID=1810928 RepID=UPI003CCCF9C6